MGFEDLMGFVEESPDQVRENIAHVGEFFVSRVNDRRVRCGRLEIPSLADLRRRTADLFRGGPLRVKEVIGDVRRLHRDPENAGALFQAAKRQVDCLEDLGKALGQPGLWEMRNGYAMPTQDELARVDARLEAASEEERDTLRGRIRIGVQHDAQVLGTDHVVTQVYGAALLADEDRLDALKLAARRAAVERFATERVVPRYEALYREVLAADER